MDLRPIAILNALLVLVLMYPLLSAAEGALWVYFGGAGFVPLWFVISARFFEAFFFYIWVYALLYTVSRKLVQ